MGLNNRPAKSQEEDLELTLAIILKHIKSTDGSMVDDVDDSDDGDDSQTDVKVATTSVALGGSTVGEEGNNVQPLLEWAKMSKIKSFGTKIKDKLKIKLGKDEWGWSIDEIIGVYLVMGGSNIMNMVLSWYIVLEKKSSFCVPPVK